jgi:uncharacterized protein (TIGR02001 family)
MLTRERVIMKNSLRLASVSLLAAAIMAPAAQAEITANVALTTDYVWRGTSQNQEDPALQGGFDYGHDSGFYAGVWGSNVNFGGASTELDFYAGWGTELESGVGVDVGIIRYAYQGSDIASKLDFTEVYVGVSYSGLGFMYSFGDELGDQYEISYGYDLENVSLAAAYGSYDTSGNDDDYNYYSAGVSGSFGGTSDLGWDVSYYGNSSEADALFGEEAADGRLVFTLSKEV